MFELFVALDVNKIPFGVQYGQCRNSPSNRYVIFVCDLNIVIHMANIYMNNHIVFSQNRRISRLLVIEVEQLAVATPVSSKVQQDMLVFTSRYAFRCGYIGSWISRIRVEIFVDSRFRSLGSK